MKLSRPIKLLVGAATVWLPLYMIAFFMIVFGTMSSHGGLDIESFDLLFKVHMATVLVNLGLLAFYLVHLFKVKLPGDQRILWGLAIFFLGPLAMPFYFFKHVWPEAS